MSRSPMWLAGVLVLSLAAAGCTSRIVEPDAAIPPVSPVSMPYTATKNTTRINTSDPAAASVLVSQTLWTGYGQDNRPNGAVLVQAGDWPVAAASASLIHFPMNGPVLFTEPGSLSEKTAAELKRLAGIARDSKSFTVVLAGKWDAALVDQVKKEVPSKTVTLEAESPAGFAKAVDIYYSKESGQRPENVLIGSLDSPSYTVPAVNWIAHMAAPLLYTGKDKLPAETVEALKLRNGTARIYLLGPEAVISSTVEKELRAFGQVVRIGADSKNSAAFSVAFASFRDDAGGFGWDLNSAGRNVSVVPDEAYDLAVAAAPFSHLGKHAPMLWSQSGRLPTETADLLHSIKPVYKTTPAAGPFNHAWLTGSEDALSRTIQEQVDDLLEIVSASGGEHKH